MTYIPGDFWRICDRCGFKVRASQTFKTWDNLIVCAADFEERHPQDFVRGRKDQQNVPDPRPDSVASFIGPLMATITADAAAGATTITVDSSVRFAGGDSVRLTLGSGDMHPAIVQSVPSATSLLLTAPLPGTVVTSSRVTNLSAVSEPSY